MKSSGERKPSAFTQTRRRLTKTWRSTGTSGFRFAPSTQSYLELTRPRSTHSRAMPPLPLVSKHQVSEVEGCEVADCRLGRKKTNGGGNFLRSRGVTFQNQFARPPAVFARRKAGDVDVADGDGLDVNRARVHSALRIPHSAFPSVARNGAVSSISSQWPGGHERDAAGVEQSPGDDARENFVCASTSAQQIRPAESSGVARGKFGWRRRENFPANARLAPRASASRGRQWFRRE